jgi:cytochrome c2
MISKHRNRHKRKQTLASAYEYFCGTCDRSFQTREDAALHRMQLECRQKTAALKGIDVTKDCKMCHAVFESLVEYKQHVFDAHPGMLHK